MLLLSNIGEFIILFALFNNFWVIILFSFSKDSIFFSYVIFSSLENNNVYTLDTKCIHSIDKNRLDKNSIDKNIYEEEGQLDIDEIFGDENVWWNSKNNWLY